MRVFLITLSLLSLLGAALPLREADAAQKPAGTRQSVLDFDEETIEGLNKRPLDSLSQLSEKDKRRRRPHLYRKRSGFRTETAETLRSLRETQ